MVKALYFGNYRTNTQLTACPSISPGRRCIQSESGIVVIRHRAGWVGAVAVFICDEITRNNFLFLWFTGFLVNHLYLPLILIHYLCHLTTAVPRPLSLLKQTDKTNGSFLVSLLCSIDGGQCTHICRSRTHKINQPRTQLGEYHSFYLDNVRFQRYFRLTTAQLDCPPQCDD